MSEETATSNKQFSYKGSLEIKVKKAWVSSEDFNVDQCPDIKFKLAAKRNDTNKFSIRITKSYARSAVAVVELTIKDLEPVKKYVNNWTDDAIFENFLIPINCDTCPSYPGHSSSSCQVYHDHHKYLIPINCLIIWHGFTDDLLRARENNIETYFKNLEFSDVKVVVKNNVEFPAHKIVLGSNSPVFIKMLTTDMKESRESCINLPELDSDTANEFLYFLYHGKLNKAGNDCVMLSKLVEVADMYCVSNLTNVCDISLSNNVSSDNIVSLLQLSKDFNLLNLQRSALTFITANINSIFP